MLAVYATSRETKRAHTSEGKEFGILFLICAAVHLTEKKVKESEARVLRKKKKRVDKARKKKRARIKIYDDESTENGVVIEN